ncbi:TetR/AcrR family transcriptional regulator [Nocardia sp. NBC_00508]|uniref:TetR/AcrR family transcriptional regulator n=1 Tax=Nocardia sp. NBC_00508 TaxID=2975992 RepID=UPI002E818C15|nr:TetR/AcrR family transcriptional regulator [Nocardia sp. NBC_00508]WUD67700.1 TetR/AcrR family transcriptional regulator [Nocardia sp. NBC_00508]
MTQPRGAARTTKGTQRRSDLLDIAERILTESGHGELTMRAVASAAEIRLGHLQYYFPNRGDLVTAVLNRSLEQSLQRLTPLLTSNQPAADLIRTLLAEQDDPRLVRIYTEVWALAARDEPTADAVRGFYRTYQEQVMHVIRTRNPEVPEDVCRTNARLFTMLIEGAALFRSGIADHADPATDKALIATAAALLAPQTAATQSLDPSQLRPM